MRGLYDQIVEQLRDKTSPPFRCVNCGSEEFRLWEDTPYGWWIKPLSYDTDIGFDLDYIDGRSGDGGGDHYQEFWCSNCDHSADNLEELVGLPRPKDLPRYTDAAALEKINQILSVDNWGVGMLEDICSIVRDSGRIKHPNPQWQRH